MKRRDYLIIYAVLWMVAIGLILFRFNPFFPSGWAASSSHGAAVTGFMIFYGPFFFILYLMTGFLIEVRDPFLTVDQATGYVRKRRRIIGLFLLALVLFVLLNWL